MTPTRNRLLALALTTLTLSGGALTALSPADAAGSRRSERCTVTAEARDAARDAADLARGRLRGTPLTETQRADLRTAVDALVQAARDAKLAPAARVAKQAELVALRASLEAATTAEERLALRARIVAVRTELKDARLTKAERAALATQVRALRDALRTSLTAAERAQVSADLAAARAVLACRVLPTASPTPTPSASPSPVASPTPATTG